MLSLVVNFPADGQFQLSTVHSLDQLTSSILPREPPSPTTVTTAGGTSGSSRGSACHSLALMESPAGHTLPCPLTAWLGAKGL